MKGERIYLRPCEPEDLENLYRWENDPEIRKAGDQLTPFSRHTLRDYLASVHDIQTQKQLRLMICLTADHRAIGTADLFDFDARHRRAAVGILLDSDFRHHGLASEALTVLTEYARADLGLHQLHCAIREGNTSSLNLFTRLGFEKCGHRKNWFINPDGFSDEILMQLLLNP